MSELRRDDRRPSRKGSIEFFCEGVRVLLEALDESVNGLGCRYIGDSPPRGSDLIFWNDERARYCKARVCWQRRVDEGVYELGLALL